MHKLSIATVIRTGTSNGVRVVSGALLAAFAFTASAAEYEAAAVLKASQILPPALLTGPDHRVDEQVLNDGFMNHYRIRSKYGDLAAASTAELGIRVHEIYAIERMNAAKGSQEFTEAIKESGQDVVEGAKGLLTDPLHTVSEAVSGVGKLFQRGGETLFGDPQSQTEDPRWKTAIGFAKAKREYASEFGVDVYTSNKLLQEHLDALSWAGYSGGLAAGVAKMAIPGSAGIAVSVSSGTVLMQEAYRTMPPTDLRRVNRERLAAMGTAPDIVDLFMQNTHFSPSQQTLLISALEGMKGTPNRGAFIKFAVLTDDQEMAFFRQRQAQMYAGYDQKIGRIAEFVPVGRLAVGQSENADLVFCAPVDHLVWTTGAAQTILAANQQLGQIAGAKERHLWVTGTVSPLAKRELGKLGWTVHEKAEDTLLAGN